MTHTPPADGYFIAAATDHVLSPESSRRLSDTMSIRSYTVIFEDENHREASLITFLSTASGMTWLGLGSAFWGIVIWSLSYAILTNVRQPT